MGMCAGVAGKRGLQVTFLPGDEQMRACDGRGDSAEPPIASTTSRPRANSRHTTLAIKGRSVILR